MGDTSLSENLSWMEASHKNNKIKSTTKIFTYTVTHNVKTLVAIAIYVVV